MRRSLPGGGPKTPAVRVAPPGDVPEAPIGERVR